MHVLGDALAYLRRAEHGTDQKYALHPALLQNLNVLRLAFRLRPGAEGDAGVPFGGHGLFQHIGRLGVVLHPDILNKDADEPGSLCYQTAGRDVRGVVVAFQQLLHTLAGALLDAGLVVDHPGNGAGRDAGLPCNVIDRHRDALLLCKDFSGTS